MKIYFVWGALRDAVEEEVVVKMPYLRALMSYHYRDRIFSCKNIDIVKDEHEKRKRKKKK